MVYLTEKELQLLTSTQVEDLVTSWPKIQPGGQVCQWGEHFPHLFRHPMFGSFQFEYVNIILRVLVIAEYHYHHDSTRQIRQLAHESFTGSTSFCENVEHRIRLLVPVENIHSPDCWRRTAMMGMYRLLHRLELEGFLK